MFAASACGFLPTSVEQGEQPIIFNTLEQESTPRASNFEKLLGFSIDNHDFSFNLQSGQDTHTALFYEIARLRYAVYCEEYGYLNTSDYPDKLETDNYDNRSLLVAALTEDNLIVGTARMVLSSNQEQFPFEQFCCLNPDFNKPDNRYCTEISRLILKQGWRQHLGKILRLPNELRSKSVLSEQDTGGGAQIMFGMYRALYQESLRHDIGYWYAAMEKRLARLFSKIGFHFEPIGAETNYYGEVVPYIADLRQIENTLKTTNPYLLAWFQSQD